MGADLQQLTSARMTPKVPVSHCRKGVVAPRLVLRIDATGVFIQHPFSNHKSCSFSVHSRLNATMGSTLAARRAGMQQAVAAATDTRVVAITKVVISGESSPGVKR
jgi:hypothetical protein